MFVGLMRDVHATFAERWLKLQIEVGPPPGDVGGPGVRGPRPGFVGGPRRPTPMVASKPDTDALVQGGTSPHPGSPPPVSPPVRNPYAGVGRNDPCPCGSGKKFKKCHGAGM